jgi:hypothetical protein
MLALREREVTGVTDLRRLRLAVHEDILGLLILLGGGGSLGRLDQLEVLGLGFEQIVRGDDHESLDLGGDRSGRVLDDWCFGLAHGRPHDLDDAPACALRWAANDGPATDGGSNDGPRTAGNEGSGIGVQSGGRHRFL